MCFVLTFVLFTHRILRHTRGLDSIQFDDIRFGLCYLQYSSLWLHWTVVGDVLWSGSLVGKRCPNQVESEQLPLEQGAGPNSQVIVRLTAN